MIEPVNLIFPPVERSQRYIRETKMWEVTVSPPASSGWNCTSKVMLTDDQHGRFCYWLVNGGLIQEILPDLSDDQREQLMTGITPEAWDEHFPDDTP
jgi:hypothetical protein